VLATSSTISLAIVGQPFLDAHVGLVAVFRLTPNGLADEDPRVTVGMELALEVEHGGNAHVHQARPGLHPSFDEFGWRGFHCAHLLVRGGLVSGE